MDTIKQMNQSIRSYKISLTIKKAVRERKGIMKAKKILDCEREDQTTHIIANYDQCGP